MLKFLPLKLRASREHLNKIQKDGKQSQNPKDTHNSTTQGGTELKMNLVKKKMMMMMKKNLSLNIGSV